MGNVEAHGNQFAVEASNGGTYYTTALGNINGETCSCKDWEYHEFGQTCKHAITVTIFQARRRVGLAVNPTAAGRITAATAARSAPDEHAGALQVSSPR